LRAKTRGYRLGNGRNQCRIFEQAKLLHESIAVTARAEAEVSFEQRAALREQRFEICGD
jgi:hypothetical protein